MGIDYETKAGNETGAGDRMVSTRPSETKEAFPNGRRDREEEYSVPLRKIGLRTNSLTLLGLMDDVTEGLKGENAIRGSDHAHIYS